MHRKKARLFCLLGTGLGICSVSAQTPTPVTQHLTFFMERLQEPAKTDPNKITRPGSSDRLFVEKYLARHTAAGIYATYMGWCTITDSNGQISFPRKHTDAETIVVITRSLQPVIFDENVIHHFIAGFDEPVQYYSFKSSQKKENPTPSSTNEVDEEVSSTTSKKESVKPDIIKTEWLVSKIDTPVNRIIPLSSVVIIARPDEIYIPEGNVPGITSGNLILPTIYALPSLAVGINALHFMKVNRYFAPVDDAWRYGTARYATMILP